jgi:hypothetical protein
MLRGWFELNPYLPLVSSFSLSISFKATKNYELILTWTLHSSSFQKLLIKDFKSVFNLLRQSLTSCLLPTWNKLSNIGTWARFWSEFGVYQLFPKFEKCVRIVDLWKRFDVSLTAIIYAMAINNVESCIFDSWNALLYMGLKIQKLSIIVSWNVCTNMASISWLFFIQASEISYISFFFFNACWINLSFVKQVGND